MTTTKEAREWGPWSVWKTELLLGGYLPLFAEAAGAGFRPSEHRTYFDLFAGGLDNVERFTNRKVPSSPALAVEADPPFTHLAFGERPKKAAELQSWLQVTNPSAAWKVFPGDSNQTITAMLDWWRTIGDCRTGPRLGAALAYVDPDGMQADWTTVKALAQTGLQHCSSARCFRRQRRTELLILFPTGSMRRGISPNGEMKDGAPGNVTRVLGTTRWKEVHDDQVDDVLSGDDSWLYYVELYRGQLLGLGYEHVSAIEIRTTKNVMLYHMVFASDHAKGGEIMERVMDQACRKLPQMIDADKTRARYPGMEPLFPDLYDEIRTVAADPARYARLLTGNPRLYEPGSGQLPSVTPIQGQLFDAGAA